MKVYVDLPDNLVAVDQSYLKEALVSTCGDTVSHREAFWTGGPPNSGDETSGF